MKINVKKPVEVEAKTLKLYMKVRDEFEATLVDQDGDTLRQYEGYVPGFMPGQHYGDYLILDIDIDTGKIVNWQVPTVDEIEQFIKEGSEDEE